MYLPRSAGGIWRCHTRSYTNGNRWRDLEAHPGGIEQVDVIVPVATSEAEPDAEPTRHDKSIDLVHARRSDTKMVESGKPNAPTILSGADAFIGWEIAEEPINCGGMGCAYLMVSQDGRRRVVKTMLPEVVSSDDMSRLFKREMEIATELDHPHIVQGYSSGLVEGVYYLVMEFCDAGNLEHFASRSGNLQDEKAVALIEPLLEALDYAHARGIVHRDIKPSNILLKRDGDILVPKLADFGLSLQVCPTRSRRMGDSSMPLFHSDG